MAVIGVGGVACVNCEVGGVGKAIGKSVGGVGGVVIEIGEVVGRFKSFQPLVRSSMGTVRP